MTEEAKIEKALRLWIELLGGLCLKWVSPAYTGAPDRIIFLGGIIFLVELKAPTGKPSPRQLFVHEELAARGTKVWVISNWDQLKQFKVYVLHATQLSEPRQATYNR